MAENVKTQDLRPGDKLTTGLTIYKVLPYLPCSEYLKVYYDEDTIGLVNRDAIWYVASRGAEISSTNNPWKEMLDLLSKVDWDTDGDMFEEMGGEEVYDRFKVLVKYLQKHSPPNNLPPVPEENLQELCELFEEVMSANRVGQILLGNHFAIPLATWRAVQDLLDTIQDKEKSS